ncbi:hypothetical protein [Clostridium beijerinckii]|uniref:hypothetical protein n=1 Tax=Clostridium beijerinckii TaxID=1520 RepID=UPI000478839E|nr:hypothetical protein [Clostridium beijerinckii]
MIVKIQKSLNDNSMLIYSEDREIVYQDTLNPDIDKALGNKCKGYFEAELDGKNQLVIGKKVKNQNW